MRMTYSSPSLPSPTSTCHPTSSCPRPLPNRHLLHAPYRHSRIAVLAAAAAASTSPSPSPVPTHLPSTSSPSSSPSTSSPPPTLTRLSPVNRALSVAASSGLLAFALVDHELPAVRLAILTYMVWAMGEWSVHKYLMHARSGSLGDRVTHLNKLHVDHHIDTFKDMTMKEGFDIHALYFHLPNTCIQILAGAAILASLDTALSLDIPLPWTAVSSTVVALLHNLLWNTMHMDMHAVDTAISDGITCTPYQRQSSWLRPYTQWVFNNHTTHHDCGGGANFNIVCPGPDFVLNTYLHRGTDVAL